MNESIRKKIKDFFKITNELKDSKIIRSSKYAGDIAEFICSDIYNIVLNDSGREEGYDGTDSYGKKVEIKFHGGDKGNNIEMSKYRNKEIKFDYLLIMLGLDSNIRQDNVPKNTYPIYKIKTYDGRNIAKEYLKSIGYDKLLDSNFEKVEE